MRRFGVVIATFVVGMGLLAAPAVAGDPPITLPSDPDGLTSPVTPPEGLEPARRAARAPPTAPAPITAMRITEA